MTEDRINNPLDMSVHNWLKHAKEYSYKMQAIEPPYDEHENELIRQIEAIQREAYERAGPYRNALVQSRMRKTARYVLTTEKKSNG